MTIRRILFRLLLVMAVLVLLAGGLIAFGWWYFHPSVQRQDAIVYGKRGDHPLELDWIRPARPNGVGVLVLVSGGWKSGHPGDFQAWMGAPLLRRGYSIFAVYHVSQPEAAVPEIIADMQRAVRFVRRHAQDYGVDPRRLGVTGGSAGGHLGLMLATRGQAGPATAVDTVDRESSAIQAAAIFYPVTDLLNLGPSTENLHDGGPPKSFRKAFGPNGTNLTQWPIIGRDASPIYFVTTNLPPVLIYHGDADTLVPLEQSERFVALARQLGRPIELVIHHGGHHGWPTMVLDIRHFADWFDRYLRSAAPSGP